MLPSKTKTALAQAALTACIRYKGGTLQGLKFVKFATNLAMVVGGWVHVKRTATFLTNNFSAVRNWSGSTVVSPSVVAL